MSETRLYNSILAEAFCAIGAFKLHGLTLKPFCLLHSLQLAELGNPLWTGEGDIGPEDLMAAAAVCSQSETALSFAVEGDFNPVDEASTWFRYLETCAAKPMTKARIRTTYFSDYGAPAELVAVTYLMRVLGIDERRAWTMPYGLAWWYVEAACEQENGDSMILTEREAAELEAMNSPEGIAERERRDEDVRWIVANVADPVERQRLLAMLASGELTGNWKEEANG